MVDLWMNLLKFIPEQLNTLDQMAISKVRSSTRPNSYFHENFFILLLPYYTGAFTFAIALFGLSKIDLFHFSYLVIFGLFKKTKMSKESLAKAVMILTFMFIMAKYTISLLKAKHTFS